ncbi:MAG: peptidylprolyl isomerase [Aggregatilineales bacterium]
MPFIRLAATALLLGLAACGGTSQLEPTAPGAPSPATAAPATPTLEAAGQGAAASGELVAARVNGVAIAQADYERLLARSLQNSQVADRDALAAAVLDMLIEQALIEQAAAEQGIVVTADMVEAEYQATRALVPDDAAWQRWLADNLYTEEEFRQSLRAALIAGLVRDRIVGSLPENVPQVRARHILVETEAEALNALARLQAGEDFGALAAALSRDVTTREQGGDLGWFADGELLEPAFMQVAFSLQPGQIAGPVATRLGYHVVQVLERDTRPVPEERKPALAQAAFERWLQGLLYNAVIERQ